MYKSHTCGEIRAAHSGQIVTLAGWVNCVALSWRSSVHRQGPFWYGACLFCPNPDLPKEFVNIISTVRLEWVLQITGTVRNKTEGMVNPKLDTGENIKKNIAKKN